MTVAPPTGPLPPTRAAASAGVAARRGAHPRRWALWALAAALPMVLGLAWAELAGWPFLARPLAQALSARLDRDVRFGSTAAPGFALHLWGGVRLQVDELQVANPAWSDLGPMLQARQAELRLTYRDLLVHRAGQPLLLARVQAETLDLRLERLADGRASWQLGPAVPAAEDGAPPPAAFNGVRIAQLAVQGGSWQLRDAQGPLQLSGRFQLDDGSALPGQAKLTTATTTAQTGPGQARTAPQGTAAASQRPGRADPAAIAASPDPSASAQPGLSAQGQGQYRGQPLALSVRTGSTAAWWDGADGSDAAVPLHVQVDSAASHLRFDGQVADPLGQPRLTGQYWLRGPSLADLGRPLGITLPSTRAVALQGRLSHQGALWHTVVEQATIGRSQLTAALQLRRAPGQTPQLEGRVGGKVLWLEDLGPAIGMPSDGSTARAGQRVLPDRVFDLPALRAMDANVLVRLDRLESGSSRLKAVAPLSAHLTLKDAVLDIGQIDARLAQGRIRGVAQLDGRGAQALWRTDLRAQGLDLADWIKQPRDPGLPPYVSGRLAARVQLSGSGRSTAQILGQAQGQVAAQWTRGQISHLVVEAAGIDIAQALGVYLKGDDALPVDCGTAALVVRAGVVRPQVFLVDTRDSLVWLEGSASLADERLDLQVHVSPKDKSPLSLRTPIHVAGAFNAPEVSLDKAGLARKLLPAAVLALVNPLAALLPLIDLGDLDDLDGNSNAPASGRQACKLALARRQAAPRL